ncbi:MAG: cell division septum initiation protein DivIVA [Paraglaciecola sp.]|jgi:cell division septum initiation protein DivIVA
MKTLFVIAVLVAGGYLLLQSSFGQQHLPNVLPVEEIQQAAQGLMDKVDKKLKQFQQGSNAQQQQIADLQQQLVSLEQKMATLLLSKPGEKGTFSEKRVVDESSEIATFEPITRMRDTVTPDEMSVGQSKTNHTLRQAGLRDIVERMDQKSLQTLVR